MIIFGLLRAADGGARTGIYQHVHSRHSWGRGRYPSCKVEYRDISVIPLSYPNRCVSCPFLSYRQFLFPREEITNQKHANRTGCRVTNNSLHKSRYRQRKTKAATRMPGELLLRVKKNCAMHIRVICFSSYTMHSFRDKRISDTGCAGWPPSLLTR